MSYRVRRSRFDGFDVGQVGAAGVAGLDGDRFLADGLAEMGPRLHLRLRALAAVARAGTPYGLVRFPLRWRDAGVATGLRGRLL